MPQNDLSQALASPTVRTALVVVGLLLVAMLLREVRRIPKQLGVLMAVAFLDMVGLLMIVPLLPFYVLRFGKEGTAVLGLHLGPGELTAVLAAAFTLAQSISSPWWGRFSDRVGRRPALLIAMGASAAAYAVFGFADSLWLLLVSRLVQGAGGGTVGVIQAYVADTAAPAERARALGWLSAATNLGVAIGPVLGSLAMWFGEFDLLPGDRQLHLGHAAPGLAAAALCLLTMLFARAWLPESNVAPHGRGPAPRAAATRVLSRPLEPASRLIWTYAIAIGAFQGTTAVLALFLNARFAIDEKQIGYVYMWIGAISVFARALLLGPAIDRCGEVRLSRIGIVTLAAGVAMLPLCGSLPMLALAVGLLPFGTAFTFPCVTALLSRVIAPTERGLYMGLQQRFGGYTRIGFPLLYGWLYDHVGRDVPFFVAAACVLPTVLLGFGLQASVTRAERAGDSAPSPRSP